MPPETKMPVNFQTFLHNSSNKEELFALLSDTVSAFTYPPGKEIYITSGQSVVSKTELQKMLPSNHEEADTRMCLHVADAVHKGATNVIVSTHSGHRCCSHPRRYILSTEKDAT